MPEWSKGYILPETLTGHALKQICFDIPDNPEYRQAFWGRIWDLGKEYVWQKDDPEDDKPRIAAAFWREVLWSTYQRYLADENCDAEDCKSYSPGAPFIQWFPNDPYNTPALVPDGYNNPPWYLATTASNIALGSSTGDVITSIDRFPPGSLPTIIPSSGLPRFRVNVSGEGIVTLHLVNLVAGSLIQLTKDDDILSVKFIDVSRDLVSIPPETMDAFQVQVEFTTPGLHWVDCIVVSWVNSSIPFLHHGGGLRQVDLCGFTDMPLVPPTMIRADPSGCGNLEKSTDGGDTWTDIDDTDFLRRDGVCAMSGGLEIYPTTNQVLLTMKGTGSPYQAAKIMVVQDGAGVDRAWINPRGDISLGLDASSYSAYLLGRIGMENNQGIYWKDASAVSRIGLSGLNGQTRMHAMGNGFGFYNNSAGQIGVFGETGIFSIGYASGAGASRLLVTSSPSSAASYPIFEIDQDGASAPIHGVRKNGETWSDIFDAGTNAVVNTLIVGHETSATPTTGFGVGIKLQSKDSTTSRVQMSRLFSEWENPTHATRQAKVKLTASDFSGEKTILEAGVTGASTPKIGFLGIAAQPRLGLSGSCLGNAVLKSVCELLALFGLATDATTLGDPSDPVPFDVTGDKFGNEALADLINGLATAGYINDLTSDTGAYVYELPPPVSVDGSWNGNEAGKLLALALDENGYITDLTDLGDIATPDVAFLNLRCRAAAAANVIVHHWYNYIAFEMAYAPLIESVGTRWQKSRTLAAFNMELQDDIFNDWAVHVFDEFYNGTDTTDIEAHMTDMINFIPDIQQAFYCGIGDDGILTASGLTDIQTILFSDNHTAGVPDDINTWFYDFFKYFDSGELALAIAHALHSTYTLDVDCEAMTPCDADEPDWCKKYNFAISAYAPPFVLTDGTHVFAGTGSGYKTDPDGDLRIDFPYPVIEVTIRYTVTIPSAAISVVVGADAGGGFSTSLSTAPGTYIETISIPEANRADGWWLEAHCNEEVCTVTLKEVYDMTGTGTEPTEGNNCD